MTDESQNASSALLRGFLWASLQKGLRDTRGAALVEYSILVGCVALAGCFGLVVVGVALLDSFEFVRRLILVPTP